MLFESLDTPSVLVDLDVAERNLLECQRYCDEHGLRSRPHIKTHKLPFLAKAQVEAGAVGITCQKVSEAEVMAEAGLEDIFLTFNILGPAKLARLRRLAERVKLCVSADNRTVVEGLSEAFKGAPRPLSVLVECDTGHGRCGVQSPEAAALLAQAVERAPGLIFAGLMTYPPAGRVAEVGAWLREAIALCEEAGFHCAVVSNGGTPDLWRAHELADVVTEHRPGTYIYNDRSLVARGFCGPDDCALTVLATVVSTPTDRRAIIDAGSKTLTSDLFGLQGHGLILGHGDVAVAGLSEEHGHLESAQAHRLTVGERLRIVPNHACVVSNMVDRVELIRGEETVRSEPVAARGTIL